MKIYDCFNFFNELEILELRLNILYDYVDYFVIVDSSLTHSGEKKPFYYEDNKERFSKFADKIINYKVYDTPTQFVTLPITADTELTKIYNFIQNPSNRWFNRHTQPDYGRDFFSKRMCPSPFGKL